MFLTQFMEPFHSAASNHNCWLRRERENAQRKRTTNARCGSDNQNTLRVINASHGAAEGLSEIVAKFKQEEHKRVESWIISNDWIRPFFHERHNKPLAQPSMSIGEPARLAKSHPNVVTRDIYFVGITIGILDGRCSQKAWYSLRTWMTVTVTRPEFDRPKAYRNNWDKQCLQRSRCGMSLSGAKIHWNNWSFRVDSGKPKVSSPEEETIPIKSLRRAIT